MAISQLLNKILTIWNIILSSWVHYIQVSIICDPSHWNMANSFPIMIKLLPPIVCLESWGGCSWAISTSFVTFVTDDQHLVDVLVPSQNQISTHHHGWCDVMAEEDTVIVLEWKELILVKRLVSSLSITTVAPRAKELTCIECFDIMNKTLHLCQKSSNSYHSVYGNQWTSHLLNNWLYQGGFASPTT